MKNENLNLLKEVQNEFQKSVNKDFADHLVPYFLKQKTRFSRVLDLVKKYNQPNAKILDAGSYPGIMLMSLFKRNCDVYGLDRQENIWDSHPDWLKKFNVAFADIEKVDELPFPKNHFDTILFLEVIEHLRTRHPSDVVELLAQHVKPGGRLIISTPNVRAISKVLALLIGKNIYHSFDDQYRKDDNFAHIHEYTKSELYDVVTRAGLEVEEFIFTTYGFHADRFKDKFNHYVVMPLKAVPCFREGMILVAKKPKQ